MTADEMTAEEFEKKSDDLGELYEKIPKEFKSVVAEIVELEFELQEVRELK